MCNLLRIDTFLFQPTRPYGARPRHLVGRAHGLVISTHAPLWGATAYPVSPTCHHGISTHAPLWGATSSRRQFLRPPRNFNPRAPMGRDRAALGTRFEQRISTHAPLWGATQGVHRRPLQPVISTHAPLWGATSPLTTTASTASLFQPTRPYGARRPA